jgi:hypothetical protein
MPKLHFHPLAPHICQVLDGAKLNFGGTLKDIARRVAVLIVLIVARKSDPEAVGLAVGLDWVYCLHSLRVSLYHLISRVLFLENLDAFVPLVDVVRVLAQADAAEELCAAVKEVLEAR